MRLGNIEQAAAELSMSVSWLRQRVMKKEVPYLKVGRRVVFDLDELVEHVLNNCRVEPLNGAKLS